MMIGWLCYVNIRYLMFDIQYSTSGLLVNNRGLAVWTFPPPRARRTCLHWTVNEVFCLAECRNPGPPCNPCRFQWQNDCCAWLIVAVPKFQKSFNVSKHFKTSAQVHTAGVAPSSRPPANRVSVLRLPLPAGRGAANLIKRDSWQQSHWQWT